MVDSQLSEPPLEVMSAMVNLVLVQIGKFFRDPSLHHPDHLVLTKDLIKQVVPPANERFHKALDEIEIEIINAKSVMERDLALIRSKRAERDRAAGLLKTPNPNDDQIMKAEEDGGDLGLKASGEKSETKEKGDIAMADSTEPAKMNASTTGIHPDLEGLDPALQRIAQTGKASITIDTKKSSHPDAATKDQEVPDQLMETPTTANLGDSAFESMFNDTENPDGDDMMDFDFSAGTNINQQLLNDAAFDYIPVNNGDIINLDTTSNEDTNSLLPGLESHLDAANNISTVFPTAASVSGNNANSVAAAPTSAPQGFESAPTESNFDDLFTSGEFVEETGDFSMTAEGTMDELGDYDNWWRTDGT